MTNHDKSTMSRRVTETPEQFLERMEFEGKVAEWTLFILFALIITLPLVGIVCAKKG